jgi:hypothetical protein
MVTHNIYLGRSVTLEDAGSGSKYKSDCWRTILCNYELIKEWFRCLAQSLDNFCWYVGFGVSFLTASIYKNLNK